MINVVDTRSATQETEQKDVHCHYKYNNCEHLIKNVYTATTIHDSRVTKQN